MKISLKGIFYGMFFSCSVSKGMFAKRTFYRTFSIASVSRDLPRALKGQTVPFLSRCFLSQTCNLSSSSSCLCLEPSTSPGLYASMRSQRWEWSQPSDASVFDRGMNNSYPLSEFTKEIMALCIIYSVWLSASPPLSPWNCPMKMHSYDL